MILRKKFPSCLFLLLLCFSCLATLLKGTEAAATTKVVVTKSPPPQLLSDDGDDDNDDDALETGNVSDAIISASVSSSSPSSSSLFASKPMSVLKSPTDNEKLPRTMPATTIAITGTAKSSGAHGGSVYNNKQLPPSHAFRHEQHYSHRIEQAVDNFRRAQKLKERDKGYTAPSAISTFTDAEHQTGGQEQERQHHRRHEQHFLQQHKPQTAPKQSTPHLRHHNNRQHSHHRHQQQTHHLSDYQLQQQEQKQQQQPLQYSDPQKQQKRKIESTPLRHHRHQLHQSQWQRQQLNSNRTMSQFPVAAAIAFTTESALISPIDNELPNRQLYLYKSSSDNYNNHNDDNGGVHNHLNEPLHRSIYGSSSTNRTKPSEERFFDHFYNPFAWTPSTSAPRTRHHSQRGSNYANRQRKQGKEEEFYGKAGGQEHENYFDANEYIADDSSDNDNDDEDYVDDSNTEHTGSATAFSDGHPRPTTSAPPSSSSSNRNDEASSRFSLKLETDNEDDTDYSYEDDEDDNGNDNGDDIASNSQEIHLNRNKFPSKHNKMSFAATIEEDKKAASVKRFTNPFQSIRPVAKQMNRYADNDEFQHIDRSGDHFGSYDNSHHLNNNDNNKHKDNDNGFSMTEWRNIEENHYKRQFQHQQELQALRGKHGEVDKSNAAPQYANYNEGTTESVLSSNYIPGVLTRQKLDELGTKEAILKDRHLANARKQQQKVLATQHLNSMIKEGACSVPQRRVERIQLDRSKLYTPPCTILYRCADDTGCCRNERQTCAPKRTQNVDLYFFVNGIKGGPGSIERLTFINHTECHCVDRSHTIADEYHIENNLPISNNGQVLRRTATILDCNCPKLFEKILQEDGKCRCDCSTGNTGCDWLKRGMEHFSMNDRKCILEGRCKPPTCEHGNYIKRHGRCPKSREEPLMSALNGSNAF